MSRAARWAVRACVVALAAWPCVAGAQRGALDGEYVYRTRSGDTLIGLGAKLLREPQRWHDVQALNGVERPRQMPLDTALKIPYRWLKLTPDSAEVVAVAGDVRGGGQPLRVGERLGEGSVLETGATGSATLAMPDGSVVTLQKDSRLELDRLERIDGLGAHDMSFRLTAGRVETRVAPQRDVGRFEIRTPVAVTAVRGTQFRATYDTTDADARTETLEGVVGVTAQSALVPVAAGFGTRVEQGAPPQPPVPLPPPPALGALDDVYADADLDVPFAAVPGAAAYRTQLALEPTFYALVRDEVSAEPRVHLADVADGAYFLRVRSVSPAGLEGPDAVHRLSQRRAPAPPAAVEPAPGASIPGPRTTFSWTTQPAAVRYEFELARSPDFATLAPGSGATSDTRLALDGLVPGTYYWRIRAVNADGHAGAYGTVSSYRQRALAPAPEVIVEGHRAHVSWTPPGGDACEVELARDAAFAYPVARATVTGDHWDSAPLNSGDYYVRIRPRDDDGYAGAPGAAQRLHVPYPGWLRFAPLVLVLPFF